MCGEMLAGLQKAIKVTIEIPIPEASAETPKRKKIKLKKKKGKDTADEQKDVVDGVELGDTKMRKLLPDMNSKLEKQ